MKLDPDRYQCPDHQVDLTEQVSGALEDADRPVAYERPLFGVRREEPRPFQVIVTCPGKDRTREQPLRKRTRRRCGRNWRCRRAAGWLLVIIGGPSGVLIVATSAFQLPH